MQHPDAALCHRSSGTMARGQINVWEIRLGGGIGIFNERSGLCPGRLCGEPAVGKEHAATPAKDHAEGEEIEHRSGLLDGNKLVEIVAGEESDGGKDDDHHQKGAGALHHDGVAVPVKLGGGIQRPGQQGGSQQESGDAPEPGNPADGSEEHGKARGHAGRGNDDLLQGDGGTAFANTPDDDDDRPEERRNGIVGGGDVQGVHQILQQREERLRQMKINRAGFERLYLGYRVRNFCITHMDRVLDCGT